VAQLVGHKDPVTFVRAMAVVRRHVPAAQALMVGDGPLRAAVEQAVDEEDLGGTVHLTGYRRDADALLAAADVVTLSSKEEGLGTALIDALSLGKPVAACAAGGIPEVIEPGVSGLLVPVGDAAALGRAAVQLLTDPALAGRLARAGPARAREFSVERTAERTLAVYRRVLAR
jgi:glycosyltransferase involved in cell wall biosynthesis